VAQRIGDEATQGAEAMCKRLLHRLDLGVDHTVVVILGGTGCGKSSLFNALAGMGFAEVGAVRPTTDRPAACVWGDDAGDLLEWLGLDRDMWIQRDSMLEEHIRELRGLILVDLPDIDSVARGHRETCQQLIPLADALVWVTDPVKYADASLHARYLAPMREHEGSMVVVLNQTDTLSPDELDAVRGDLAARLSEDGLAGVPLLATSALTGEGVDALSGLLTTATRSRTTSAKRGAVHLREVARDLASAVGDPAPHAPAPGGWVAQAEREALDSLFRACGGMAAVAALAEGAEPPSVAPPHIDQVRMVLLTWLQRTLDKVPPPWGPAIGHTLASSQNIHVRLGEVLPGVHPAPRPGLLARLLRRGRAYRARADRFETDMRTTLAALITLTMTAPTVAVLEDWALARETLARIAGGQDGIPRLAATPPLADAGPRASAT
jgi:energy-coupling factor transporter ATP-binding protein EcfA2